MTDTQRLIRPWLTLCGCVVLVVVLYWAQEVIVPVALAGLVTFALSPVVASLQRRIGRIPAVLAVVAFTFSATGATAWVVGRQMSSLVEELPQYRDNIRKRLRDLRVATVGESVERLQKTVEDLQVEMQRDDRGTTTARVVVVEAERSSGLWSLPGALAPWLGSLAEAGLAVVLVAFMLLERQGLRDRLLRLFGHGRLPVTTRALDDAACRVSRYLLVQSLINLMFGLGIGLGLSLIGVPYAVLWGFLAAGLRFIPYVGPVIATLAPLLVALAVLEGWTRPLLVAALFIVLEVVTNVVVETVVVAGAVGVSQVGLLVAVAFWTWLWGPIGLLLATPLTVCLVVLGRHVPDLEFVTTLLADQPALDPDLKYYQRLLAGDHAEAAELLEEHVRVHEPESVYDGVMLPALNYAVRDRLDGRLSDDEERAVIEATSVLLDEVAAFHRSASVAAADRPRALAVLACPIDGEADALALRMLGEILRPMACRLEIISGASLPGEVVARVTGGAYGVVCVAHLSPSPPSRSRHLVKRLRAALPDIKVVVGRWGPPALIDEEEVEDLKAAGADHVGTTLLSTREQLEGLLRLSPAGTSGADGTAWNGSTAASTKSGPERAPSTGARASC